MHIINEPQLDFSDVLIRPKRSELASRKDVNLNRRIRGRWNPDITINATPIMLSNMDNITTWEMTDKLLKNYCMVAMNKFVTVEEWVEKLDTYMNELSSCRLAYTIGIRKDNITNEYIELGKFRELYNTYPTIFNHLIIDVPNGYSVAFADFVEMVRKEFPLIFITAGNVVSAEMVQELILRGADCVKVGIGNGNVCKTRLQAGVGRPQLSTIIDCADAAHANDGYIISDGGCKNAGDVCKAFCAGADFVMLGSMFAGHDECDGDIIEKYFLDYLTPDNYGDGYNSIHTHYEGLTGLIELDEEPKTENWWEIGGNNKDQYGNDNYKRIVKKLNYKEFWGMSSKRAMEKHYGKMENYRSSEGREVLVPYKGPVQDTINDLLGGIRSMCTYIGARKIKNAPKCATFYMVNRQVSNMFND